MTEELKAPEKTPYYGIIDELFDERNWQLAAGIVDLPKPRMVFDDTGAEYYQDEIADSSCTIHGCIGAVTDQTGLLFTKAERKELWQMALDWQPPKYAAKDGVGWWTTLAVDLIREYTNKNKLSQEDRLNSYHMWIGEGEFWEALSKGYTVVVGFKGNKSWNADKNADGILDGIDFGKATYAHCVRMIEVEEGLYEMVIDNYPNHSKSNRYKIPRKNLEILIKKGIFHFGSYVFAYAKDVETAKYPPYAVKSIEKAIKKGVALKWDDPEEIVGNGTLEWTLINLGALSQQYGNVSKARLIVAYDRLGLLD